MNSLTNKIDLQSYTKQYSGWLKSISELFTPEQFLGLRQANWFLFEKNNEA